MQLNKTSESNLDFGFPHPDPIAEKQIQENNKVKSFWINPKYKINWAHDRDIINMTQYKILTDNIWLFQEFVRQALSIRSTGQVRWGARTILEYIRHETKLSGKDKMFKVNNDIQSCFSVCSMTMFPELKDFFEVRTKKYD